MSAGLAISDGAAYEREHMVEMFGAARIRAFGLHALHLGREPERGGVGPWLEVEYGRCGRCENQFDVGGEIASEIPVGRHGDEWICQRCHRLLFGAVKEDVAAGAPGTRRGAQ